MVLALEPAGTETSKVAATQVQDFRIVTVGTLPHFGQTSGFGKMEVLQQNQIGKDTQNPRADGNIFSGEGIDRETGAVKVFGLITDNVGNRLEARDVGNETGADFGHAGQQIVFRAGQILIEAGLFQEIRGDGDEADLGKHGGHFQFPRLGKVESPGAGAHVLAQSLRPAE
jgi:hypothetical protein